MLTNPELVSTTVSLVSANSWFVSTDAVLVSTTLGLASATGEVVSTDLGFLQMWACFTKLGSAFVHLL